MAKQQTPKETAQSATELGAGGETHQHAPTNSNDTVLTTNHGTGISDNQNSLKAGGRGATLLEDFILREKIFHFDHERIPERVVHARGSGAHGFFELTQPIPELSKADLFQRKGERCPVFVRFSTVAGGAGSVDTPRDVRGFAVKFYTQRGNWDLVGNNIPVFFIQDAIKFPDLIHAVKMEADRGYPQAASAHDTFWDFVSLIPESTHMLMWAMSDRTLPRSLRMIEGFGIHTFRLVNAMGQSHFVKFHWKPRLGLQSTTWDEAMKLAGADPDFHRRDLFEAIERKEFPEWELAIQVFDEAWAAEQPYDVLDSTKLIPEEVIRPRVIGRLVLDRNVSNFFAETEQVAFMPSNIVPGIDFSNDPLLQGRLFSYLDTQKSRLGTTNFHQIPINAPKCPFANFQRDGMMQTLVPQGRANYEPNSLDLAGEARGPRESHDQGFASFPENDARNEAGFKLRMRSASFADHYSQARLFWRSQMPVEQAHIVGAFAFELSKVARSHVRDRVLGNLRNVDDGLAKRIANAMGIALPKVSEAASPPFEMDISPALSIVARATHTLVGRTVGVVFAEGSDEKTLHAVCVAAESAGARVVSIAPKLGEIRLASGRNRIPDTQLISTPSVIFDAIALVLTEAASMALASHAVAVQFVSDAFVHLKAIGATDSVGALLDAARVKPDEGIVDFDLFIEAATRRYYDRESVVGPQL